MKTFLNSLTEAGAIALWIRRNRNLLSIKNRMKKQLPKQYRKKFYKTWVLAHLGVRRRHSNFEDGRLAPLTIKISPTMRCNLACVGCFAGNYPISGDMPFKSLESIVVQAASLGIPSVGIIGGEPLLFPNILDLFKQFPETGFYLVTNGTRVTPEVVYRLTELPNVITTLSVDGFEKTNDELRGEGVFVKIVRSMDLMREAGIAFGFSTTVHRKNFQEVISEHYLDFMIEHGCLFGAFLPYIPVGSTPMYDFVCSQAEVQSYYRRLDALGITRPLLILKEGYSDGTFLNSGCGAAHTMHVTEKGEVEPCNGIEFATDNVHRAGVEGAFMSEYFRDIRKLHAGNSRKCLVIAEPGAVLEIVKKHHAQPTHTGALEHLEHYAATVLEQRRNRKESLVPVNEG